MGAHNSVLPTPSAALARAGSPQHKRSRRETKKPADRPRCKAAQQATPCPSPEPLSASVPRSPLRQPLGAWSLDGAGPSMPGAVSHRSAMGSASATLAEGDVAGVWPSWLFVAASSEAVHTAPRPRTPTGTRRQPPHTFQPSCLPLTSAPAQELLDEFGLLLGQKEGLEALNRQSLGRLAEIYAPGRAPTPEEFGEAFDLKVEVDGRRRCLAAISATLTTLRAELEVLGRHAATPCPAVEAPEPDGDGHDEDDLCQICWSQPIEVQYPCCQYRGACEGCALTIHRLSGRCPHCRASLELDTE